MVDLQSAHEVTWRTGLGAYINGLSGTDDQSDYIRAEPVPVDSMKRPPPLTPLPTVSTIIAWTP